MSRRYLSVKIIASLGLTDQQFRGMLEHSVRTCFGELGLSRIDPKTIRVNTNSAIAVVSCERNSVAELEAALALTTEYAGGKISLLVLRVSGTIKGLRKSVK